MSVSIVRSNLHSEGCSAAFATVIRHHTDSQQGSRVYLPLDVSCECAFHQCTNRKLTNLGFLLNAALVSTSSTCRSSRERSAATAFGTWSSHSAKDHATQSTRFHRLGPSYCHRFTRCVYCYAGCVLVVIWPFGCSDEISLAEGVPKHLAPVF